MAWHGMVKWQTKVWFSSGAHFRAGKSAGRSQIQMFRPKMFPKVRKSRQIINMTKLCIFLVKMFPRFPERSPILDRQDRNFFQLCLEESSDDSILVPSRCVGCVTRVTVHTPYSPTPQPAKQAYFQSGRRQDGRLERQDPGAGDRPGQPLQHLLLRPAGGR